MRTIAIGDIHGQLAALSELFVQIEQTGWDRLVFLGDYINPGPDSKGTIDFIRSLQDLHGSDNVVAIKGNHEDMCFHAFQQYDDNDCELAEAFYYNGGETTLESFKACFNDNNSGETKQEIPQDYLDWMKALPVRYEDEKAHYIHGGALPGLPIDEQEDSDLLWKRDTFLKTDYMWDKVVIHGHTPMEQVVERPNIISIDTGAGYGDMLTAFCVETKEIMQVQVPQ
jgi:serine/threonine protein phosphatase 1